MTTPPPGPISSGGNAPCPALALAARRACSPARRRRALLALVRFGGPRRPGRADAHHRRPEGRRAGAAGGVGRLRNVPYEIMFALVSRRLASARGARRWGHRVGRGSVPRRWPSPSPAAPRSRPSRPTARREPVRAALRPSWSQSILRCAALKFSAAQPEGPQGQEARDDQRIGPARTRPCVCLERAGLKERDVQWVYIANGEAKAALSTGAIDAWSDLGQLCRHRGAGKMATAFSPTPAACLPARASLPPMTRRSKQSAPCSPISWPDSPAHAPGAARIRTTMPACWRRKRAFPSTSRASRSRRTAAPRCPIDQKLIDEQRDIFERYKQAGIIPAVPNLAGGYDSSFNDAARAAAK